MSKTFRGFVILSLIIFSYYLLHPSIMYYFFTSPAIQKVSEMEEAFRQTNDYSPAKLAKLNDADEYRKKALKLGLDLKGGLNIVIEADFVKLAEITDSEITDDQKSEAVDRVIFQLRNRIDATGVSEVKIRKVGAYRINIQLPGETSSKRIENIISTTGNLTFRMVDESSTAQIEVDEDTGEVINKNMINPLSEVLYTYELNALGKKVRSTPIAIEKQVMMTGDRITSARVSLGEYGEPVVAFDLDATGASDFAQITSTNIGRRMAIILDGKVQSSPSLNVAITGGQAMIEGSFNQEEAKDLSLILKSGSLPVPIQVVTKDLIAPKVGEDLKTRGIKALFGGLLSVLIFILLRYRISGMIASLALLLNGFIIVAFLASLGLTISLPGLAGILLTVGMAIDANVIIYERIREEIKLEKRMLIEAIDRGYRQAFWAIFDANVTTLMSAFVLFYYGTGMIQGFATTLFVGIVISMFTSLFFTRFVFDFLVEHKIITNRTKLII